MARKKKQGWRDATVQKEPAVQAAATVGVEVLPAAPELRMDEIGNAAAEPIDAADLPGWMVTIRGTLPKVYAAVAFRVGPVRAQTETTAIARVMSELGTQLKKPGLLDVLEAQAVETKVTRSPALPFAGK